MKKLLFILIAICTVNSFSQQIEITPQYGYQLGSKYSYNSGHIKNTDSDQFGVTVGLGIEDITMEFTWTQQNTAVKRNEGRYPIETHLTNLTINHYQFGATYSLAHTAVIPFVGVSAGWVNSKPENNTYESSSKFEWGVTGGMKYFFSEHIGIRLQSQLLVPINWGGVYIENGNGNSVYAGGTILQLNFSGGLIFAFGS